MNIINVIIIINCISLNSSTNIAILTDVVFLALED